MNKLASAGHWLLARWEEPSTWAGTSVVAVLVHNQFGATGDAAVTALAAIGAFLAFVMPEKKS